MGHMEALKKKELVLAVCVMSREEFDQLVAARNEATAAAEEGTGTAVAAAPTAVY